MWTRARRKGDTTLLGPVLHVFLHRLKLPTLSEDFLSSWCHCDGCICRRELGSFLVTPDEAAITHLVLRSLRLELFVTRRAGFSDKLLDHVDYRNEVANMLV